MTQQPSEPVPSFDATGRLQRTVELPSVIVKPSRRRQCTIVAVDTALRECTINLAGDTTQAIPGVKYLDPYTPLPGDNAWALHTGTDLLVIGSQDRGVLVPAYFVETTADSGYTSTTYTAGSPTCGGTFVAPPSGWIIVSVGAAPLQVNGTAGNTAYLSWELREGGSLGSGTVVSAAADSKALRVRGPVTTASSSPAISAVHRLPLQTQLVPGDTYNIRTMHRVTGETGTLDDRALTVEWVQ